MWMVRRILGWLAMLSLAVIGMNFWSKYDNVRTGDKYNDMAPEVKPATGYFIDVTQRHDVQRLKESRAIVQYWIRGRADKDGNPVPFFGRIMAVPGDTVEIRHGVLLVSGQPMTPHILGLGAEDPAAKTPTDYDVGKILVPRGYVYIALDSWKAQGSGYGFTGVDSRSVGMISVENIAGVRSQLNMVTTLVQIIVVLLLAAGYYFFESFIK